MDPVDPDPDSDPQHWYLHVYLLSQAEDLAHVGLTGSGSSNSENTRFGSRNKMTWSGFMGLKCMDTNS